MDILKKLGYKGDPENEEEVNNFLNNQVVNVNLLNEHEKVKEIINKQTGKIKGSARTAIKKVYRDQFGVEIEGGDELTLEDFAQEGALQIKERIAALEKKAEGSSGELEEQYKRQIEELERKKKDAEQMAKEFQSKYQETESKFSQYQTNLTKKQRVDQAWSGLNLVDDKYKVKGFQVDINEKYEITLAGEDEESEDGLIIRKGGQRVHDNNGYLTLKDVLAKEAQEAGLIKMVDKKGEKKKIEYPDGKDLTPIQKRALAKIEQRKANFK